MVAQSTTLSSTEIASQDKEDLKLAVLSIVEVSESEVMRMTNAPRSYLAKKPKKLFIVLACRLFIQATETESYILVFAALLDIFHTWLFYN